MVVLHRIRVGTELILAHRQTYMTTTIKPSLDLFHTVWGMWNTSLASIRSTEGLGYSLVFQPIPSVLLAKSAPLGGNSLGLDSSDAPLMLVLLASIWNSSNDDIRVISAQQDFLDRVNKVAATRGLDSRFRYLNYAFAGEDPISGYGPQSKARLQATSKKYDPTAFFQKAVPGGFKLFTKPN